MNKIFIYDGNDVEKVLTMVKSAVLSFSETPMNTVVMIKSAKDAASGVSQIKRWISASSFSLILIEDLSSAFKGTEIKPFLEWLKDHAEDYEGPYVIIREAESCSEVKAIAKKISNIDELLLNIR